MLFTNDRKVEIVVTNTTASPTTCAVGWGQWRGRYNGWQFNSPLTTPDKGCVFT